MGEKFLPEEEIASQVLPATYFDSVYEVYLQEWMKKEVNLHC